MSRLALKGIQAASGNAAGGPVYVEDVFSTHLYKGNGSTQTITNGIDLAGEGGLVWIKNRTSTSGIAGNFLLDTVQAQVASSQAFLSSNSTAAADGSGNMVTSFNSNGFGVGANNRVGYNGTDYASWTFRKQPGFFDIVTYTGDGADGRTVSHNLGSVPGMIIVKRTDSNSNFWFVYHRSLGATHYLALNETQNATDYDVFYDTTPTSTEFTVNNDSGINGSGGTYVAYLFAHDAQDFGTDEDEAIIKCGSYTGNGSTTGPVIDLGFEPQWLMVKRTNDVGGWFCMDIMREMPIDGPGQNTGTASIQWQESNSEGTATNCDVDINGSGFQCTTDANGGNANGSNYIYMAIRRPHKPASEFAGTTDLLGILDTIPANASTNGTVISTVNHIDMIMGVPGPSGGADNYISSRFQKGHAHRTQEPNAEFGGQQFYLDYTKAFKQVIMNGTSLLAYTFARAPGFFDFVAYSGTGSSQDGGDLVAHNLGVIPEMTWRKKRNGSENWAVWLKDPITPNANSHSGGFYLNTNAQYYSTNSMWRIGNYGAGPTATHISKGLGNNGDYIVYLFASVAGVSKVGTYTGTGSDLNVNCGFSSGARFVLIKRTDSSGDWYLWDSLRGIVAGNDPYILLNTSAAEVSNTDYIDPLSSGFTVTSSAPAALNASSGEYVFLAIA
jgi:hypothetical protein